MQDTSNLYENDFFAWTQEQARLIKEQAFNKLDLVHLFDEVEDMGNRHADGLESSLTVLLMHLLKWEYQPNMQSKSWQLSIKEQRRAIAKCFKKMPSLKTKLPDLFIEAYEDAIYQAEKETGLDESTFPKKCKWSIEQTLNDDFLP